MRQFFKKSFYNFIRNKRSWISCIFAAVLFFAHLFQFIDSSFNPEPLIRLIFCGCYPFFVFFFGEKIIPHLFLIFALTIEQFSAFNNYTAIFILSLYCVLFRKASIPVLCLYILDVVIVCMRHDRSAVHLLIHFANCFFILLFFQIVISFASARLKKNAIPLDLDDTDRIILDALKRGCRQKEIDGLSENTVSKRLKKMRERNFCLTNQELLLRYTNEMTI